MKIIQGWSGSQGLKSAPKNNLNQHNPWSWILWTHWRAEFRRNGHVPWKLADIDYGHDDWPLMNINHCVCLSGRAHHYVVVLHESKMNLKYFEYQLKGFDGLRLEQKAAQTDLPRQWWRGVTWYTGGAQTTTMDIRTRMYVNDFRLWRLNDSGKMLDCAGDSWRLKSSRSSCKRKQRPGLTLTNVDQSAMTRN